MKSQQAIDSASNVPINEELSYFTRIFGAEDREVPLPSREGLGGRMDVTALQEIIDYLNAVNIAGWKGMRADATFTSAEDNKSNAVLTLGSTGQFRLDVETTGGTRSTRIDGYLGSTLDENGTRFTWSPASAAVGLVAFPRLFATSLGYTATAIVDRGFVTIDQSRLHRITVQEPASADLSASEHKVVTVTDLYFNATTHLLIMSASSLQLAPFDPQRYMIVVSYGDYRKVDQILVPFRVSQSVNGQHQWSLQLADVNLAPTVDPSYFTF